DQCVFTQAGSVEVLGMVSPAYVVGRPIGNKFVTGYIEQLLRTAAGAQEAKRYSRGVTDFRLRLYWDEFKNIRVPLPPKDEQVAIMHALDDSNARIDGLATEAQTVINLLGERRAALISAAVTGKIDIREHPSALAEAA
ncbi:restriction endonuclease subunit S, partial [Paraburkholderia phytofirmans]